MNEIRNARAFYERVLEDELRAIMARAAVIRRVLNRPDPDCKHCKDCRRCKNCPDR